jgi:hypothetical protein
MRACPSCGGALSDANVCTQCNQIAPAATEWKWGWSPIYGVHYGPVPVGIIVVVIVAIGYFASRH